MGISMRDDRLMLPNWDALEQTEREELAESISRAYPEFELTGILRYSQGDQAHEIACFDWRGIEFVLIPGSEAVLGYDRDHSWVPSVEENEGYEELRTQAREGAEYRYKIPGPDGVREHVQIVPPREMPPLEDYLRQFLTPLRRVRIPPFLLEVSASRAGIRHLEPEDPDYDSSIAERLMPGIGGCAVPKGGRSIQYRLDRDGTLRCWEERSIRHDEVMAAMAAHGFRLPTSDEREYACGAGSRTLFRWGDHSPPEFYRPRPLYESAEERHQAMEDPDLFIEKMWELQDAPRGYEDPSPEPNAFGVFMTLTDGAELCFEPGITRGGDGGMGACGGMDPFTAYWLPQATSYVLCSEGYGSRGYGRADVRRAFSLG